jgi:hypothetical protein
MHAKAWGAEFGQHNIKPAGPSNGKSRTLYDETIGQSRSSEEENEADEGGRPSLDDDTIRSITKCSRIKKFIALNHLPSEFGAR